MERIEKMKKRLNVLYQSSDLYAPFAGVSITALFENNVEIDELVVYLINVGISEENIKKFQQLEKMYGREIIFIDAAEAIEELKDMGIPTYHGSYATYLKLFVLDKLPEDVDKIMYIDSDTVVTGSLAELCDLDMGQNMVGGIRGCLTGKYKKELGCKPEESWYNLGVALFNVKQWKEKGATKQIQNHLHTVRANYAVADQDLINVLYHNQYMTLSPKYNLQSIHLAYSVKTYFRNFPRKGYYSEKELSEAIQNPSIVHLMRFVGEYPWHKNNAHPCNELFDYWLKRSLWKDYEKEPADNGMVLKIEKSMYKCLPRPVFLKIFRMMNNLVLWKDNYKAQRNK